MFEEIKGIIKFEEIKGIIKKVSKSEPYSVKDVTNDKIFGSNNSILGRFNDLEMGPYDNLGGFNYKENQFFDEIFLEDIKNIFYKNQFKDNDNNNDIKILNNTFKLVLNEENIGNSDNIGLVGNGISITYYTDIKKIYISLIDGYGIPLIIDTNNGSIYLDDAKKLKEDRINLLISLDSLGFLKKDIPHISNTKINKQTEKNKLISSLIEKNDTNDLPFDSTDTIKISKNHNVLQRGATILNNPEEGESIYTFGAGPCSILIVDDYSNGKIGLSHIDSITNEDDIKKFLNSFSKNMDIKIISGEKTVISNILECIHEKGLDSNISFMNIDSNRSDAAAIKITEGKAEILYGHNYNIVLNDSEEMKLKIVPLDMSGKLDMSIK